MAMEDFRGALLDFDFSEKNIQNEKGIYQIIKDPLLSIIYMARGLAYSQLHDNDMMCFWLRKSGDKGNKDAFNLIKEYCQ